MQIVKNTKDEGSVIVGYECDDCAESITTDSLPETWFRSYEDKHYCEDCKMENAEYWKTEYFTLFENLKIFIEKYEIETSRQ